MKASDLLDSVLPSKERETITIEVETAAGGMLELIWRRPSVGAFAQAMEDMAGIEMRVLRITEEPWPATIYQDLLTMASCHVAPVIEDAVIDFYIGLACRSDAMFQALQVQLLENFPQVCRHELLQGYAVSNPAFAKRLSAMEITGIKVKKKETLTASPSATSVARPAKSKKTAN